MNASCLVCVTSGTGESMDRLVCWTGSTECQMGTQAVWCVQHVGNTVWCVIDKEYRQSGVCADGNAVWCM